MAKFLRDKIISNVTITPDRVRQIGETFQARYPSTPELHKNDDINVFIFYVIRFDNKGYRVFSLDDLISYFENAENIERIIFTIESKDSMGTNRNIGSYMELRLEINDPSSCHLTVSSDEAEWFDASFSVANEAIERCKNKNSLVRNDLSALFIQLAGVFSGFALSLWAAAIIGPKLDIENSFFISFLLALLLFSNIWTYLNPRILRFVNKALPNVKFHRDNKDAPHWLYRTIIGGLILAGALFLLSLFFNYIGNVLSQIIGN